MSATRMEGVAACFVGEGQHQQTADEGITRDDHPPDGLVVASRFFFVPGRAAFREGLQSKCGTA